ncbi:hypothetical protein OSB04_015615 [Centaurea solstitialis]|uniref:Integrase catalytic domain-containing protein n=1 Tax=Centaurea solstitialis TaxID=347529 RepID=A0AA38WGQ2_9ASTR|nr:hypothetical protein OSB04_015615 [Centaurea solstitialis]
MSMMGELNFFLGLQVKQLAHDIFINQSKYVHRLLKRFDLEGTSSAKTPMCATVQPTVDLSGTQSSPPSSTLHPAQTIHNIKTLVPLTLDLKKVQYNIWAELFQVVARAHLVMDHLDGSPQDPDVSTEKWNQIDAIVLSWIYGTISEDLLLTIIKPKSTARDAWLRVKNLFHDNKSARAADLENQFNHCELANFSDVNSYCQHLKSLADQLSDVDQPVSDHRLVLQLINGLSSAYDTVGSIISNQEPLPSFLTARSMLLRDETRRNRQTESAAFVSPTTPTAAMVSPSSTSATTSSNNKSSTYNNRNRNRNTRNSRYRGNTTQQPRQQQQPRAPAPQWYPPYSPYWQPTWAVPPCPYPTAANRPYGSQGLLGPPPRGFSPSAQAHVAPSVDYNYQATELPNAFNAMTLQPPDDSWYMDTGASAHMAANPGKLRSVSNSSSTSHVLVGDGFYIPVKGSGIAQLSPSHPHLTLSNVLITPNIIKNLVSVRKFTIDNQVSIEFDPFGFSVKDLRSRATIMRCNSSGELYPVTSLSSSTSSSPVSFAAISPQLWHHRLGHPGDHVLSFLRTNNSILYNKETSSHLCPTCEIAKHKRLSFTLSTSVTYAPFDIIHSDLWTSPVLSRQGHRYYLVLLDDFTHYVWVYPLKQKSDVYQKFIYFHSYVKTHFEKAIKSFQCDMGREFDNTLFRDFCNNHGIQFRFSCPHTSSQNGKAERMIRTLNDITRSLLTQASMPPTYWVDALFMANYLHNILPTKTLHFRTPTQALFFRLPTYAHLKVFGCLCFPNMSATTTHKLSPHSTPCVFLGFPPNHRGYACLDISSKKIIISRHVTFDETIFPFSDLGSYSHASYEFLTSSSMSPLMLEHYMNVVRNPEARQQPNTSSPLPQAHPPSDTPTPTPCRSHSAPAPPPSFVSRPNPPITQVYTRRPHITPPTTPVPPQPSHPMTTRAKDGIHKPKQPFNLHTQTTTTTSPLPRSHISAMQNPHWKAAMHDEYDALIKNRTWDLVERPPDANVIRCMWLFKHKFNSDGSLQRHKARLVVNGRGQQVGIDCDETFSPVVKPVTIRTVLSLALSYSWPIHQLDVKNAFLHGDLQETVYMHQPPGFVDPSAPRHVCLLRKSLYGLKQAPRAWYQRFATYLVKVGFIGSKSDSSLFIYKHGGNTAFLLLYVDDIILTASSTTFLQHIIGLLSSEFAMTDLGPLSYFLGISVTRSKGAMFLSQRKYAEDILQRANMSTCKPVTTPVDTKSKLSLESGSPIHDPTLYRRLAGALQYLTFSRPDIAYAVQQICLFMHAPREAHLIALKRILRYIRGTLDYGLLLLASPTTGLIAYSDADWGGCPDTRRSTSGYCVYLGDNLLSWSSKRQPTLSRSSAEAEYRAVANAVAETSWLRNLLLELHCPIRRATLVYCDNVSAVYLSSNPVQHQRTKHVEMDIHFVREKVALGQVRVLHVPSTSQYADIFTKGLPSSLFLEFRSSLNVLHAPISTEGV